MASQVVVMTPLLVPETQANVTILIVAARRTGDTRFGRATAPQLFTFFEFPEAVQQEMILVALYAAQTETLPGFDGFGLPSWLAYACLLWIEQHEAFIDYLESARRLQLTAPPPPPFEQQVWAIFQRPWSPFEGQ